MAKSMLPGVQPEVHTYDCAVVNEKLERAQVAGLISVQSARMQKNARNSTTRWVHTHYNCRNQPSPGTRVNCC